MANDEEGPTGHDPVPRAGVGELRIVVESDGGRPVVRLVGELDLAAAGDVRSSLTGLLGGGTDVVVDLAELTFIDSSGMAVLLVANRLAHERGHNFTLRRPAPNVARALSIGGIDQVISVERQESDE
jgi:anti-sigma B factor antagonist